MRVPLLFPKARGRAGKAPGASNRDTRTLTSRFAAATLVLVTGAGAAVVAPQPAQADFVDELLSVGANFVPYYRWTQTVYDLVRDFSAGHPNVPGLQATIAQAQGQIIAAIEGTAADDVTSCADDILRRMLNIGDSVQSIANDAGACLDKANRHLDTATDQGAINQLGLALNVVGPLALIANQQAGFVTSPLRHALIVANTTVVTKLAPTCKVVRSGGRVVGDDRFVQGVGTCTWGNPTVGTGRLPYPVEYLDSRPIDGQGRIFPTVQDYSIAKNQALATTSYTVARAALNSLNPEVVSSYGPALAAASTYNVTFPQLTLFQADSTGTVLRVRDQDVAYDAFGSWASFDGLSRVTTAKSVAAVTDADGHQELFIVDHYGSISHRWQAIPNDSASWSDPATMDGQVNSIAAARNADGTVQLFATNNAGNVWTRWQLFGSDQDPAARNVEAGFDYDHSPVARGKVAIDTWSPWTRLDGSMRQVVAATNQNGKIELFGVDVTGAVFHAVQAQANFYNHFTPYAQIPGTLTSLAVTNNPTNQHIELFGTNAAQTSDNVYWSSQTDANGTTWSSFTRLPGVPMRSVAAGLDTRGTVALFGMDYTGQVYSRASLDPAGHWWPMSSTVSGDPVVTAPASQATLLGNPVSIGLTASSGTSPYTWTVSGLPPGTSVSDSTITGAPLYAGWYTVTAFARDSNGKKANTVQFSWHVSAIQVPDVTGMSLGSATAALLSVGLGIPTQHDVLDGNCNEAIGTVLSTVPTAGTLEPAGFPVHLEVEAWPTGRQSCN
jgi:hypothetical protein